MNKYDMSYIANVSDKTNRDNFILSHYFSPKGYKSIFDLPEPTQNELPNDQQTGGSMIAYTSFQKNNMNHIQPRNMAIKQVGFGNLSFQNTGATKSKNVKLIL